MAARILTPAIVELAKEQQGQADRLATTALKIEGLDNDVIGVDAYGQPFPREIMAMDIGAHSAETSNTLRYVGIAGALGLAYLLLNKK